MHDDPSPDTFGPDLFDRTASRTSDKKSLKATASTAKQSPLQREFDRLIRRIEEGQALLAAWKDQPTVILSTYHAKIEPAIRDLADAQKSLVVQLDALLTSPPKGLRITARRRSALTECLLDLIETATAQDRDDTMVAIFDRYNDTPMDKVAEEQRAEDTAEIIDVFEQVFGKGSIEQREGESHDDFLERARAQLLDAMAEEERREDEARQRRAEKLAEKRAAKKNAKKHAKAQTAQAIDTANAEPPKADLLRTLYRKLASSIHPDRESDPAEKVRKTETMQGLNSAYENKDLLALLKLHNQTLQSDTLIANALAEDTLREYNALLKAQHKSLEAEIMRTINDVVPPSIMMKHGWVKRPEQLERLMHEDIRNIARTAESIRETVRDLNHPKLRTEAINDIVEMTERRREFDAYNDFDEIDEMMAEMMLRR
jgi:hypothetical protein